MNHMYLRISIDLVLYKSKNGMFEKSVYIIFSKSSKTTYSAASSAKPKVSFIIFVLAELYILFMSGTGKLLV